MNVHPTPELRRNLILAFDLLAQATYCRRCQGSASSLRRRKGEDSLRYAISHLESADHETIADRRAREPRPVERPHPKEG